MARYSKQTWDTTSIFNPTRMNHIEQGIYDADLTEGGTMTGNLTINRANTGTSTVNSQLILGNNISEGSVGASRGLINLYSDNDKYLNIRASNSQTGNHNIYFPDSAGTLALREDLHKELVKLTPTTNETNAQLLARFQTALADITGDAKRLGIISMIVGGNEKVFHCARFTSNNYMAFTCIFPSASLLAYEISYGGSGNVSFVQISVDGNGFSRVSLNNDVAEGNIVFKGFVM